MKYNNLLARSLLIYMIKKIDTGFPFARRRRLMFKNIFHDINTMFRNYKYISHGQGLMWIIWVNEGTRGKVTLYL